MYVYIVGGVGYALVYVFALSYIVCAFVLPVVCVCLCITNACVCSYVCTVYVFALPRTH